MDETLLKNGNSGQIPSIISGGGVFLPALGMWFPKQGVLKKCFEFFFDSVHPPVFQVTRVFFHMRFFRVISSKYSENLVV